MIRGKAALMACVMGAFAFLLPACDDKQKQQAEAPALEDAMAQHQTLPEAAAYYAANPEFFVFATPEDLPQDLTWEDGMDLPDIGSANAKKGGTWNDVMQDFPRTFRTVGPDSNGSFRNYLLDDVTMGSALRHPNVPGAFYPALASSWAISKERKTVYVRLNPKAKWSDGHPITADDMMFMFFFYQSKHINAPWYNNWYGTRYVNITKYDDLTFSVQMPDARPDMDARVLSLRPQPEHFYTAFGEDFVERYQWQFVPTTGPYIIEPEDVKKGRAITLTRNDNWWARDNKFYRTCHRHS
jgi:microcin C transport system substrate-binding protein